MPIPKMYECVTSLLRTLDGYAKQIEDQRGSPHYEKLMKIRSDIEQLGSSLISSEILSTPIKDLDLTNRTKNALLSWMGGKNYRTFHDLLTTESLLKRTAGIGKKGVEEIVYLAERYGYKIPKL